MKPLTKVEYAKLMAASREIANEDKKLGVCECVPMHSAKFKELIKDLAYKPKQAAIKEYATAFNGYRLDVRKLPGMFSDNKEY